MLLTWSKYQIYFCLQNCNNCYLVLRCCSWLCSWTFVIWNKQTLWCS